MRILVYEPWKAGGHYLSYMRCYLPPLAAIADETIVCVSNAAYKSDNFQKTLMPLLQGKNIRFDHGFPLEDPRMPLSARFRLFKYLCSAINTWKPEYVLIPSADGPGLIEGLFGYFGISKPKVPIEATFHHGYGPGPGKRPNHFLKEWIYQFGYSGNRWFKLNFMNPLIHEFIMERKKDRTNIGSVIPSPTPKPISLSKFDARELLGVPTEGRLIGMLGQLDARKAIPELLAAFEVASLNDSDRLLLAGKLNPDFARLISQEYAHLVSKGRLIVQDRFLSNEELRDGYQAFDVVTIPTVDQGGVQSLMLMGIVAKRPVIVTDFGCVGTMIRRFDLGAVCDIQDRFGFARTIEVMLDDSLNYTLSEAGRRFVQFHSVDNFIKLMLLQVRKVTGDESEPNVLFWDNL